MGHSPEDRRFRRRLSILAMIALAGLLVLVARLVWLQAVRDGQGML
ncbi:hypothetical protein [Pseudoduganella sp. UC29_71]|jgi:hypothetical protein